MIYTRFLEVSDYGYYDIVQTTINILAPIITLQISDAAFRFLLAKETYNSETKIISSTVAVLVVGLILFTSLYITLNYFVKIDYKNLVYFTIVSWSIYVFMQQIARGKGMSLVYTISGIVYSLFLLFLSAILIIFTQWRIEALFISNIAASLIGITYLLINTKISQSFYMREIKVAYIKKMLTYSIPLLFSAICWWMVMSAQKYLITYFMGINSNGIFAVAFKFVAILNLTNGIFYLAWQEAAIREYGSEDKKEYYSKMFGIYIKIQFTLLLLLLAGSRTILKFSIGNSFNEAWLQLPFLYYGGVFSGLFSFYCAIAQGIGKTLGLFISTFVGAVVTIVLNFILLPVIGLYAASIAYAVSFFIMWALMAVNVNRHINIEKSRASFIGLIMLTLIYSTLYYFQNVIMDIGMLIFGLSIAYFINRQIIKSTIHTFKERIINIKKV